MEQWFPLQGYVGYSASNKGKIRNDFTNSVLSTIRVDGRRSYVGLMLDGSQVTRSLSRLICETFVDNDNPELFDTPIHLDGDLSNCEASNLQWRPRWFANKHSQQFNLDLPENTGAVRNIDSGVIYEGIWSVVFAHGVLFNDVIKSIVNKTNVFPLRQRFEWA